MALLAGLGFGGFLAFIAQIQGEQVFAPLVFSKLASVSFAFVLLRTRQLPVPKVKASPVAILSGFLDAGGNIFYLFATQFTRLDIAAVLSSLYPAGTVLLSSIFLKEKLTVLSMDWCGRLSCCDHVDHFWVIFLLLLSPAPITPLHATVIFKITIIISIPLKTKNPLIARGFILLYGLKAQSIRPAFRPSCAGRPHTPAELLHSSRGLSGGFSNSVVSSPSSCSSSAISSSSVSSCFSRRRWRLFIPLDFGFCFLVFVSVCAVIFCFCAPRLGFCQGCRRYSL